MFSKALECRGKCLIVLLLGFTEDEYVVADVHCARDAIQAGTDGILKNFRGARDSKIESLVAHQPKVGAEGGDVSGFSC